MYLIRSVVKAQPGRRDELVGVYREFSAEFPALAGANPRVLTASIGPSDSTVIMESEHATLAEFEAGLEKVNRDPKMANYGPKFADMSVAGSHRFEVYRIHK